METRARYILIGLFTTVAILIGFVFVYWLENDVGLNKRTIYQVHFEDSASGLRPGATVLFNGIRVGEVTALGLDPSGGVLARIAVDPATPLRADTRVHIEVQGLMGSAALSLAGGTRNLPLLAAEDGQPPMLRAASSAGQDMMQMARQVLARIDTLVGDNSAPLHETIDNLKIFSQALARNANHIDGILAGLDKMTAPAPAVPVSYEFKAPTSFPIGKRASDKHLIIAEPTALLVNDTQKILAQTEAGVSPIGGNLQWSDNLPKLFQDKIIESFENADVTVARPVEGLNADYQLLTDIRGFHAVLAPKPEAEVAFSAKIVAKSGEIVASRLFKARVSMKDADALAAATALDEGFGKTATELVIWTSEVLRTGG